MKQFLTAAKRGAAAVNNPVDITFEYEVNSGEFIEMTAHPPTVGQLALFLTEQGDGTGFGAVRSMFQFVATILSEDDYAIIERQLHEGLDLQVITDIVTYLTQEWAARPTQPSSGSSSSRKSTGRRSTVKQLPVASTT